MERLQLGRSGLYLNRFTVSTLEAAFMKRVRSQDNFFFLMEGVHIALGFPVKILQELQPLLCYSLNPYTEVSGQLSLFYPLKYHC